MALGTQLTLNELRPFSIRYRAQAKKCQRSHQGNTAGDVSVLQDANEMPDDVDSWFNNVYFLSDL